MYFKQRGFFFDLDYTLFQVNTSFLFGRHLYRQRFFSTPKLLPLLACYAAHSSGLLSIPSLHKILFSLLFQGKQLSRFTQYLPGYLDHLWMHYKNSRVIQALEEAQARGDTVAILSSSPDFLVRAIAERFKVNHWIATKYEVDNQEILCKISVLVQAEEKIAFMDALAEREGIARENCIAFSDSHLDLSFLQAAGHSVAVHPDAKLRAFCQKMSWEIWERGT